MKRKARKLPKQVRPDEFPKLIKQIPAKNKHHKIAFLLAYGSGMRISEVIRCRQEHFREDGGIFIPESKGGVERIVPKPKGWRESFFKELPISCSIRALQIAFKKYSEKAGLDPNYTFHSLRHGFATRLHERGMSLNQLQLLLGHSNISITSIYTKASPKDALKSYEEFF